jgi:flagellar biosynthesis/type III secretory pathway protein FliH
MITTNETDDFSFDAVLELESSFVEHGMQEGFRIGEQLGREEGYQLGLAQGHELGKELGYYLGCALAWEYESVLLASKICS